MGNATYTECYAAYFISAVTDAGTHSSTGHRTASGGPLCAVWCAASGKVLKKWPLAKLLIF